MQLKSLIFGTNIWGVYLELLFFVFLFGKLFPYRIFKVRHELVRGFLYFMWYTFFMIIIIFHNHYSGNPVELPKFNLNMEIVVISMSIILNLIHNSGHDNTILKRKVRTIRFLKT